MTRPAEVETAISNAEWVMGLLSTPEHYAMVVKPLLAIRS